MKVHPTAIIDAQAEIGSGAEIGPYVVIEGPVKIGRGTRVMAHAYLTGWTEIGECNEIHPGAVLGDAAQDRAYDGAETYLRVGDNNFLMATAHVGHNCKLGDNVILANGALLGGYVEVGNNVFISGHCVVHQFVKIGDYALMRGLSGTSRDVPPFAVIDWQHTVRGVNVVGLRRAGFDDQRIRAIREAFRILFRKGRNLARAVKDVEGSGKVNPDVSTLLDFIKNSKRGVCFGASASPS